MPLRNKNCFGSKFSLYLALWVSNGVLKRSNFYSTLTHRLVCGSFSESRLVQDDQDSRSKGALFAVGKKHDICEQPTKKLFYKLKKEQKRLACCMISMFLVHIFLLV